MAKSAPSDATPPRLRVKYYRRMRINRVYPVHVSWAAAGRGQTTGPVTVRLVMAGAQVVPLEQQLDPGRADAKVTFHVTPIAKGWLHGERVEVVQEGRKVQEIKLPCKVTSQRCTWLLLLLTFLIPFGVIPFFTTSPLPPEYLARPPKSAREGDPKSGPGRTLTERIQNWAAPVPDIIDENAPQVSEALYKVPGYLGYFYNLIFFNLNDEPLGYYSFLILLGLTVLSWWWHRTARKTRKGEALTGLARAGESS